MENFSQKNLTDRKDWSRKEHDVIIKQDIGSRVKEWVNRQQDSNGERPKGAVIAERLGINDASRLSKVMSGHVCLSEIISIARCMGITIDELINGVPSESNDLVKNAGLTDSTVKHLIRVNNQSPELIRLLNAMIENEDVFNCLLNAVWLYANGSLIRVNIARIENFPLSLDWKQEDFITTALALSYIQQALAGIKFNWPVNEAIEQHVEEKVNKMMEKKKKQEQEQEKSSSNTDEESSKESSGESSVESLEEFSNSSYVTHLQAAAQASERIRSRIEEERLRDAEE